MWECFSSVCFRTKYVQGKNMACVWEHFNGVKACSSLFQCISLVRESVSVVHTCAKIILNCTWWNYNSLTDFQSYIWAKQISIVYVWEVTPSYASSGPSEEEILTLLLPRMTKTIRSQKNMAMTTEPMGTISSTLVFSSAPESSTIKQQRGMSLINNSFDKLEQNCLT